MKLVDMATAFEAIQMVHDMGTPTVVLSSCDLGPPGSLICLASCVAGRLSFVPYPHPWSTALMCIRPTVFSDCQAVGGREVMHCYKNIVLQVVCTFLKYSLFKLAGFPSDGFVAVFHMVS